MLEAKTAWRENRERTTPDLGLDEMKIRRLSQNWNEDTKRRKQCDAQSGMDTHFPQAHQNEMVW